MKKWIVLCLSGLVGLTIGPYALFAEGRSATVTSYLLFNAPGFDPSISQLREKFNADSPKLPLGEFRSTITGRDQTNLTRAASKVSESLYAPTALERDTLKIKSIQTTWLPIQEPEQEVAKAKTLEYINIMIRVFVPTLSPAQSQQELQKLLTTGKGKRHFADTEDVVHYMVVDHGEEGLALAIEPIKLALSETLESNNK